MWRYLVAGLGGLLLIGAVAALVTGQATPQPAITPPPVQSAGTADADPLPDMVPEASAKTREERRFGRYDKDKNGAITREEYLANRRKAFARLDLDHDGALSFDEWSAKTIAKFAAADADRNGAMNPAEFLTTAVKRKPRPKVKCACPAPAPAAEDEG